MLAKEDGFYYFPEKNIYYDGKKATCYYSLNGGKSWDSARLTGNDVLTVLGPKISLKRPEQQPWVNNDSDLTTYHGISLNVVNDQTISMAQQDSMARIIPEIIPAREQEPAVVKEEKTEDPPKKGLRKLIDKIFGKKKPKTGE